MRLNTKKKVVTKSKRKAPTKNPNTIFPKMQEVAVVMLKNGSSHSAIKEELKLMRKGEGLAEVVDQRLDLIITEASKVIREEYDISREHIVSLHVKRYDRDIANILENKYKGLDPYKAKQAEMNDLWDCLDVMSAKEKLLQMHGKSFQVRINNKLNAKVIKRDIVYDLSALTLQEKIEFLQLLQKSKKDYSTLTSVKLNNDQKVETIDIEHEVIKENPNIALIKKKSIAKEDNTSATGSSLLDLQRKIQQALEEKARVEFLKKGARNV